jgi:hypothetical protein
VRVDSASADFSIDVSGTSENDFVHYSVDESWTGQTKAEVTASGGQTLLLSPPEGATFRVRSAPIEATPDTGTAVVVVEDAAEPRFTISEPSADVAVTYYDTIGGTTYALVNAETGEEVARDQAESPVSFWASGDTATYVIQTVGGGGGGGAVASTAKTGPFSTFAIFVGLAGSIAGFVVLGRRLGASGWRQNLGLVAGGVLVGTVALEAVTAQSLLGQLAEGGGAIVGGALGGFVASGAGVVASSIGMFWAVYAVYERSASFPRWLLIVSGIGIGAFTVNGITDGALGVGLEQVSPLIWLGLVFGGIALLWRVLQPRPIQIRGGNQ